MPLVSVLRGTRAPLPSPKLPHIPSNRIGSQNSRVGTPEPWGVRLPSPGRLPSSRSRSGRLQLLRGRAQGFKGRVAVGYQWLAVTVPSLPSSGWRGHSPATEHRQARRSSCHPGARSMQPAPQLRGTHGRLHARVGKLVLPTCQKWHVQTGDFLEMVPRLPLWYLLPLFRG